jgi:hypothetical protein
LIFTEGGKPENPEKNPRSKGENQQTQLTYDTDSESKFPSHFHYLLSKLMIVRQH